MGLRFFEVGLQMAFGKPTFFGSPTLPRSRRSSKGNLCTSKLREIQRENIGKQAMNCDHISDVEGWKTNRTWEEIGKPRNGDGGMDMVEALLTHQSSTEIDTRVSYNNWLWWMSLLYPCVPQIVSKRLHVLNLECKLSYFDQTKLTIPKGNKRDRTHGVCFNSATLY